MSNHEHTPQEIEAPVSLSHFVHTIRAYSGIIIISIIAVGVLYAIGALLFYLFAPSYRITSQAFRVDFTGADRGNYPNGTKFSMSEITSTPILMKVFNRNGLERFMDGEEFVQSVGVVQANPKYERLAAEYQSRLADPKLTPLDRDRIQKEWEIRSESLGKSDEAITFIRSKAADALPETVVRKVLLDTLNTWANFAVHDQHVLEYDLTVLSPELITAPAPRNQDPLVAAFLLRTNVTRLLNNVSHLSKLPSANLIRTAKSGLSLADIQARLEDILRYQLEPLVASIRDRGSWKNSMGTLRLLESQLAYDQRQLAAQQERAETIRQALQAYMGPQQTVSSSGGGVPVAMSQPPRNIGDAGSTTPQLSDSFIDRLLALATKADDVRYRQSLVDAYRDASLAVIPLQQAVAYDQTVLDMVRSAPQASTAVSADTVAEIDQARNEVKTLTENANEIYHLLSDNINPATHLYTLTSPPVTRVERAARLERLALYGILVCLLAFPVAVLFSVLHNRVREEERAEHYGAENASEADANSVEPLTRPAVGAR